MIKKHLIPSEYDSLNISALEISRTDSPKAVIMICHGICGKKERFTPLMEFLSEHGYACIAHDHRGHGESVISPDDHGYSYGGRAKAVVSDIGTVVKWVRSRYGTIPLILLGHSMGSLAARGYVRQDDTEIKGLIICGSPSYNALSPVGRALMRAASLINNGRTRADMIQKMTSDRFNRAFRNEGPQSWTCSDPEIRKGVQNDPDCNFSLTADYSLTILELMKMSYSNRGWKCSNRDMPILFLSGADDPCMRGQDNLMKSVRLMKEIGYENVHAKIYPHMRHEVLNEIGKEEVWEDIKAFCSGQSNEIQSTSTY